jgi:hypothetical protein
VQDFLAQAQAVQDGRQLVQVLRWDKAGDRLAQHFRGRVAVQTLGGRIPARDGAVQRFADDRVLGRRDDRR